MENIFVILFLVFLEGLLSFDNALALAAMVKGLPHSQQQRALTYGIFGAFAFRFISLFFLVHILESPWIRLVGGLYLVWLAVSHFWAGDEVGREGPLYSSFWRTVVLVELTDIVFSIDSILAAAAMSQVLWIVVTGGILGIIMMRFVSSLFIILIEVYPRLEKSAFLLVGTVGVKLLCESQTLVQFDFHSTSSPAFYIFWATMASSLLYGFSFKQQESAA